MIKTETRSLIDAQGGVHEYLVTQFVASEGFRLQARLSKLVAPLMSGIKLEINGGLESAEIALDTAAIVECLLGQLDDAQLLGLVMALFKSTRRDGQEMDKAMFDGAYAGNYGEMAAALGFIIEANGFFGLGGGGGNLLSRLKSLNFLVPLTQGLPRTGPSGE